MATEQFDVIVVGAGMAGASLAWELSAQARVVLVEREEQPGYHSTGRSAAAFIPSYGYQNRALRALTLASRGFLERPPAGFSEVALLRERGLLTISERANDAALRAEQGALQQVGVPQQLLSGAQAQLKISALRGECARSALFEPEVFDIDVDALHQGYLRGFRSRGGQLACSAEVSVASHNGGQWHLRSGQRAFTAPVVVNAAGAWADQLAQLAGVRAIGLQPLRRTAVLIDPPEGAVVEDWPLLLAHDESFYLKPDAGALLVSPADEHPSPPTDARPEELDVAYAVHHAQRALAIDKPRVRRSWAGLRCFVADRTPVIGFEAGQPGFFWLCGQGGHGIQTAPAAARCAAALLLQQAQPDDLQADGFNVDWIAPTRLRDSAPRSAN